MVTIVCMLLYILEDIFGSKVSGLFVLGLKPCLSLIWYNFKAVPYIKIIHVHRHVY